MSKSLAIAYAIKRKAKGAAEKHLDSQRLGGKYIPDDEMKHAGIVDALMQKRRMAAGGQLPESEDYLAENNSYPDPDFKELDMLDPDEAEMMADGGQVTIDPDKAKQVSDSFKGAFGFGTKKADGGEIVLDPDKVDQWNSGFGRKKPTPTPTPSASDSAADRAMKRKSLLARMFSYGDD